MKNTLIVSAISLFLLLLLEIICRVAFPEFKGHIHTNEITLGKNFYMSKDLPIRLSAPGESLTFNQPIILVLGDSISHGYGLAYEDIYWVQVQRRLRLQLGNNAPVIVSLSYGGNNLNDTRLAVKNFIDRYPNATITKIIYQFNFNDIVPDAYGRAALRESQASTASPPIQAPQETKPAEAPAPRPEAASHKNTFAAWRLKYLNHSVLFRLTQHYAGQISHKTSGTCTERGLDALGPYTWAYGSEAFVEQSNMLWNNFSDALADLKKVSASTHASLGVFVSPLLFDIDLNGVHPHFNHLNFDFSCARIDPRKRLYELTHRLDIPVYDPTDYMRESFANRIKEGNFSAYYLTADENHVTPIASTLLADYLYAELSK